MKRTLLLALLLFNGSFLQAQKSFLQVGAGYGFSLGGSMVTKKTSINVSDPIATSGISNEGVYGSYGSGLVLNGSYAHMFSENLGFDLALQYLEGAKYEGSDSYSFMGYQSVKTNTNRARGVYFSPALLIQVPGKVRPYAKLGIVAGSTKILVETFESATGLLPSATITETESKKTGGITWGARGALGIAFGGTEKMNFFTELTLTAMSYFPKQQEVTKNEVDGVEQPASPKTVFKREISYGPSSPQGQESTALGETLPMGSIGINVGIRVKL